MPAHDARSRRRRAASAAPPEDAAPFPSDAATPSAHDADERADGGKRKAKAKTDAKSPSKTGSKGGGKTARAALDARLAALEATAAALADRLDALTLVVETAVHASIATRPKARAVARRPGTSGDAPDRDE